MKKKFFPVKTLKEITWIIEVCTLTSFPILTYYLLEELNQPTKVSSISVKKTSLLMMWPLLSMEAISYNKNFKKNCKGGESDG